MTFASSAAMSRHYLQSHYSPECEDSNNANSKKSEHFVYHINVKKDNEEDEGEKGDGNKPVNTANPKSVDIRKGLSVIEIPSNPQ